MNFTDLDDNTIAGAIAAGEELGEFTGRYIAEFKQAAETSGWEPAAGHPLASEHVADMIEIAHRLIHKGYAYEKLGSIYFDISKFKKYGQLSGIDLSKIKLGQTVDLDNYEKENPRDFTLLNAPPPRELKPACSTRPTGVPGPAGTSSAAPWPPATWARPSTSTPPART